MYRRILIGGMTAAAIVGAGGAALATTGSDSSPTTNGTPSSTQQAAHHGKGARTRRRRLLRRVDHARIVVHTKHGFVTRELVRGTVKDVSATSITVTSADHTTDTFAVGTNTVVLARTDGKRSRSTIGAVAPGDHVFVGGIGTSTPVARHVFDRGTK